MTSPPTKSATCARCAGMMIPPSAVYDVPGADDEPIFADILKSLERDRDDVGRALAHLAALAGGAFADLATGAPRRGGRRLSRRTAARRSPRSSAWCCFATTATTG